MRIELKDENQEEPQKIDENDIRYKHESDLTKKEKRELEKMKLSSMGLGGRLQYIWAYYKPQMAAVVAVIAIAFLCGESFGIGTLANIFICPMFLDLLLYLNWIPQFESFWAGLLALLAGMELLALGTWMYMKSALGSGPRDALMVVLARKTHRTVGICRAAVEVVIVFIGWRLGGQVGAGTVIAAVGVGSLFNLNFALLRFNPALLHQENLPETLRRFRNRKAAG